MVSSVQLEDEATNLFANSIPSTNPSAAAVSSTGETSDNSARRVRGYSRNIELDRYVHLHGKIPIQITDDLKKPVCEFATKFSNAIGTIVRESFPVRISKWKDVTTYLKDHVKNKLLNHFELDFSKYVVHEFIDHEIQSTFKEYRADLVKHYRKYSPEEGRAHPHPRVVNMDDWHFLCDRWETPKWKKTTETNKKNRSKLPFNHCAGSKTFMHILQIQKEKGVELGPIELFEKTRYKEGKGWVNPAANVAHSQMIELQETPTPEGSQPLAQDEIVETILGSRSGHVKGMGWGPKPKQRKCSSSSGESRREHELSIQLAQLRSENAHQVEELNETKDELNRAKAEIISTRTKLEEVETRTTTELASLRSMLTQILNSQGGPSI